jgi:2-iminobutanoate/2-iminopropanoate deaminase
VTRRIIHTGEAPAALGPYSQAVLSGDTLYSAGQVALDPTTGKLVGDTAAEQARQVMKNLAAVLAAADMTFADVVKSTIYLASMEDFGDVNDVYGAHFESDPPARSTVEVAKLPLGARVEVDVVAVRR